MFKVIVLKRILDATFHSSGDCGLPSFDIGVQYMKGFQLAVAQPRAGSTHHFDCRPAMCARLQFTCSLISTVVTAVS